MTKAVRLEIDGPIAVITNDNQDKHNAFDDDDGRAAVRHPRRAAGAPGRAGRHLAGGGQVVVVGSRRVGRSANNKASSPTTS